MAAPENPFVFGEVIDDAKFVDRTDQLDQLVRDLADGQKVSSVATTRRIGAALLQHGDLPIGRLGGDQPGCSHTGLLPDQHQELHRGFRPGLAQGKCPRFVATLSQG